jgi:ADP-ribose pyrophosphatase
MTALFLYGTLRHLPVLRTVAQDATLCGEEATLPGRAIRHAVDAAAGQVLEFPVIVPEPGAQASGLLIRPGEAARARLDAYERAYGYGLERVTVNTGDGPVQADLYLPETGLWRAGELWDLDNWARDWGEITVLAVPEIMDLVDQASPRALRERYRMLQGRAASRARARAHPAPTGLRRAARAGDVETARRVTPYTWFFGVEESDLRFRRFDGTLSAEVKRAAFVMADAVSVLPYDPVTDRVMLVEQFRYGPHARGVDNAWMLEPIAGRIDGLESPQDAARREAMEEAGLSLRDLVHVQSYYPTPGAVTEYLISYVGITSLGAEQEGVGGVLAEAEDIRAHVIPYDRLLALLDAGEIENGPLVISTLWLIRHRDALRARFAPAR